MDRGFRIGRIFGISINIDWSWVFIFVLVAWNLSVVFGQYHPDWSTGLRWGLAILAALLFFASVLAHELAHSLMARAKGVPVRSITLFLFGGVSNIQRNPQSPGAEFLITIVGPATSVVLGIIFLIISTIISGPINLSFSNPQNLIGGLNPATTFLLWLGSVNIIVGIFNLIPGFPLDGGRVLRSFFWAITDNLRQATRWASWVGQGVAWLMIGGGIAMAFGIYIPFFGSGLINGLWLAFIGWFLNSASMQSYRQIVVQDLLEGVPVKQMMRTSPPVVVPDKPVSSLVHEHVMGTDDQSFPVLDGDRLLGLVTLDDIRSVAREKWDQVKVHEIMTPSDQLITVSPDEDASDALSKLSEKDIRQLPVLQEGQLVGMLRRRDIVQWMQLQSQHRQPLKQ
ncbi:MAG: site-2 protease family protein [Anaerolineales bacterium]|jgi:Zn-dependent protease/predicted transcriptional regulator